MSVEKIDLSKIEIDDEIYPRKNLSQTTIKSYVESLNGGAVFPPIILQKIYELDEKGKCIDRVICLDGWHRVNAYREYNKQKDVESIKDVSFLYWIKETINREDNLEALITESAIRNLLHGERLIESDLQSVLVKIVELRPIDKLKGIETELGKKFGKSQPRINQLVGKVIASRMASRDSIIYKLHLLDWTNEEIGKVIGLTPQAVGVIEKNINTNNFFADLKRGIKLEDIAKNNQTDLVTTWAILLQGKEDLDRFSTFGESEYGDDSPMLFNIWNFVKLDLRLGQDWIGRIPGQIALNVINYFTKPNDLVVDPMAGGGSTIDACLVMGRKCRAYDIVPSRIDIVEHDITKGYHQRAKDADLVFLDPPYWNMVKYSDKSISSKSLEDYYKYIDQLAKNTYEILKPRGIATFIICDLTRDDPFQCLSHECAEIFKKNGFKIVHRISAPLTTQSANGDEINKAREKGKMLGRDRVLYVFQKL